eukprot:3932928-Rhodomonas_salina.1
MQDVNWRAHCVLLLRCSRTMACAMADKGYQGSPLLLVDMHWSNGPLIVKPLWEGLGASSSFPALMHLLRLARCCCRCLGRGGHSWRVATQ